MKAILIRTVSEPASPRPDLDFSGAGISFSGRHSVSSPRSELHFQLNDKKKLSPTFRRSTSETSLIRPKSFLASGVRCLSRRFSRSIPARIAEEDGEDVDWSLMLKWKAFDFGISSRAEEAMLEEVEFSGGGVGEGRKVGGGGGGDEVGDSNAGGADKSKMGAYYQEMLKANPGDPLLLSNYGRFLHEVEGDVVKAKEYYGRAILASPGDGEVLSLYGQLVWETQRDGGRAQGYFDQAIQASPDDCYVLGSYAHFLWDAEEEDETDMGAEDVRGSPLVAAF